MADSTKRGRRMISALLAAVTTISFYSCDNRLANPPEPAQIALTLVFPRSTVDSKKDKSRSFALQSGNRRQLRQAQTAGFLLQAITRVTTTVINSRNIKVISERELTLVQSDSGDFVEGELNIPVHPPEEIFFIEINAFENQNLLFIGRIQITLRPGEIRAQPVAVPLLSTGDVQVTLTWNNDTDQDLHVIDPSGFRIYFDDDTSSTGGKLDVDDTDGFGPENIFWPPGKAPAGRYQVQVVYYGGQAEVPTAVTVVVRRSDAPTQTFSRTINARDDTLNITDFVFIRSVSGH